MGSADFVEATIPVPAEAWMSLPSFVRHFRPATGSGPREYLIRMRLEEACILLPAADIRSFDFRNRGAIGIPGQSLFFPSVQAEKRDIEDTRFGRNLAEPVLLFHARLVFSAVF